jgi:hypothetical protein
VSRARCIHLDDFRVTLSTLSPRTWQEILSATSSRLGVRVRDSKVLDNIHHLTRHRRKQWHVYKMYVWVIMAAVFFGLLVLLVNWIAQPQFFWV